MERPLRLLVALMVVVAGLGLAAAATVKPASADDGTCRRLADGTWYCEHGTGSNPPPPANGGTGGSGGTGGGGSGGTGGYPPGSCIWIPFPDQESMKAAFYPDALPDEVVEYYVCNMGTLENPVWAEPYVNTSTRLSPPGGGPAPPPPPIPPGALAAIFWVSVQGTLEVPQVVTTPDGGTASIIEHPTFLAVSNWVGEMNPRACHATGTCVELHLVPQLSYDPGVPGVDAIACAGGGSYFDPAGADPETQAEGACAYTYERRTGTAGRPTAYAPTATIEWTATWRDVTPGGGGTTGGLQGFEISSAPWTRPVDEVQGVVVEAEEGLG